LRVESIVKGLTFLTKGGSFTSYRARNSVQLELEFITTEGDAVLAVGEN